MAEPLVSLLIPTFNSALTIADAIASCTSQTYRNIEILVYDEASKDNTREFIRAAAARDPRIRMITSEANSGPVRAWRVLLHEAKGKWCTFVWSDDLILPRYVETLVSTLQANPKHLIAGCNCYIDHVPAGVRDPNAVPGPYQPTKYQKLIHEFETVTVKGDVYALGILAAVFPVSQICSLFDTVAAREVFDHYIEFENPYGFDFSRRAYGNDVSFLSELGLRSGDLVQVGEPLVVCRASPDSMTVNAQRHHRWQYWLQYVWAIRSAWTRCRSLSPRMDALIAVVDARVSLCDTFYSLERRQWPREGNLFKIIRAGWFLLWQDRRIRKSVSPQSIGRWLGDKT